MLRTLLFCHVNIFIQKLYSIFWCIFLSLYFMLCMTGLPLWDSKHEHNTVNKLCSPPPPKKIVILQFLQASPQWPPLSKGHFRLSRRWAIVERFDFIRKKNSNILEEKKIAAVGTPPDRIEENRKKRTLRSYMCM